MRRVLFTFVMALLPGLATTASADLIWSEPAWTVTSTLSDEYPPYGTVSASTSDPAADNLTIALSAFAENPPGPGGPRERAHVEISRSFRVVGDKESVTLRLPIAGDLSAGPYFGTVGADLTVQFDTAS